MADAEEYRRKADQYRRQAAAAADPRARERFLEFATYWDEQAIAAEKAEQTNDRSDS